MLTLISDTDRLSFFIVMGAMQTNKSHTIIHTHVNKRTERSEKNVVPRFILLVSEHSYRYYNFLSDRALFLTEITVFLSILLYFAILIYLVLYLTEHLGKIDQSLHTGLNALSDP